MEVPCYLDICTRPRLEEGEPMCFCTVSIELRRERLVDVWLHGELYYDKRINFTERLLLESFWKGVD